MGKIQRFLWWTSGSRDNLTWANFGKQNWRWPPAPPCVHWKRHRVYVQNVPMCTPTTRTCWNTCARGARAHGDVLNVHTGTFLNPHTGFSTFVQRAATHTHKPNTHDHQQHHDHNDTHHTTQHTTSRGDRETEKEKERQRQRETRQEGRRRWKRTDETRQEKMKVERQDKTRQERREKIKDKRREDREKRRREKQDKRRDKMKKREKMKEKRRDKMKKKREDESENESENKERSRWKGMKEKIFFLKNVWEPSNPPDELAENVSKKNPSRTNYSSIFLRKFRILPCFQLFTWFEFDFFGQEELIQNGFGAA